MRDVRGRRRGVRGISLTMLGAATGIAGSRAAADPIHWDGTGTSWNSPASWSVAADGSGPDQTPTSIDIATFNITGLNTAQTVDLNAGQSVMGIAVNSTGSVALQGGGTAQTLSLGTSGIVLNAGAGPLTVGSATAGQEVAISLQGSQQWANSSGAASAITINNAVSLGVSGGRTLTLGGNTASTVVNVINGTISDGSGTLALTMSGSADTRWFLANANTYSGVTTVTGGALRLTNGAGLGSTLGGTVVQTGGGLFLENNITVAGEALTISGDGPAGSSGALQNVSGTNRWTGDITVNTGTTTGRIGAIGTSTLTIDGDITATGTGQLVFQTGTSTSTTGTIIVNGDISFPGQRLTKSTTGASSGTVILTGSNNYGNTIISSGVVQFGNGGTTGNLGTGPVSIANTQGGTLAFKRSDNITVGNTLSGAGAVSQLGTGTVTLTGPNTLTGATNITAGGTLALDFTGLAAADPANVAGTGLLTMTGGRLNLLGKATGTSSQAFSGFTLNAGASAISVNSNGGTATNLALGVITRTAAGGTVNLTLPASGSVTTPTANTATGILGGYATVSGTDWAVSAGDGTTAGPITALGTYINDAWAAGNDTTVTASSAPTSASTTNSLRFNAAAATNVTLSGANVITSGGILVTSNVGANLSQITGGTLASGNATDLIIHQNNTAAGLTISSTIQNSITKSGDGLLTLTGTTVAPGITTRINAGTLSVSSPNPLGSSTGAAVIQFPAGSTGTLQLTGNNTYSTSKGITLTGNGIVDVTQTATMSSGNSAAGAGSLTKTGAGTLVFSAATNANTYTGATIINQGTLQINTLANGGSNSGIGAASSDAANLVLNGGTLRYMGTTATSTNRLFTLGVDSGALDASAVSAANTMSFTNPGAIALAGSATRTLILTGSNTGPNAIASILGDGGGATSVLKSGAGSWVLTGANTYTGDTDVLAGSLTAGATGSLGLGDVDVDGGSLTIPTGVSNAIADTAILSLAGGGAANTADTGFAILGTGVNEVVGRLFLGGVEQTDFGSSYGAPGSGADHQTPAMAEYFSGAGVVTLVPEPTAALSLGAMTVLLALRRHRRCRAAAAPGVERRSPG